MTNEIYNRTVFKRFFEENDEKVLAWANNVLSKVSSPGILPAFIQKDSEDFQSYWGTLTHLFALIVIYARQYNEIDTNKILFELFIENRGLVTNEISSVEQMQYLFDNYIKEYEKRGKIDIVSKEGVILGELLRLIQYSSIDEFIFAVLATRDSGWTLGYSSPTWNRTDTVLNIAKGYEKSISVKDLSKYPLINETGVVLLQDVDNEGNPIQVMSFVGNSLVGIGVDQDKSKLLSVSENLAYQISCKVKVSDLENQNLKFGVQVYDSLKRPMSCIESFGNKESNEFTSGNNGLQLVNNGIYYELRATISKKNRSYTHQLPLNFFNGRGLKFVEGIKFMNLYFIQDRTLPCSDVYIYDIKIKPLYLPFTQGYLGEKNVIASYYENNSSSSLTTVNEFIETYLISYRNTLKSSNIVPLTHNNVKFKVISDRRIQIEGAKIEINGQTLTTDVNGETSIELYPGSYLYSVSKDKFTPIENDSIEILEEEEQIIYIVLQGEIYERKIIFSVKDEGNRPVSNAVVTFNGKFQSTGNDGTTTFMAYPGLYSYTVTKDSYFQIEKTILVQDDMVEEVILEKIPISDVTFIVKNGNTPISGVSVTLTAVQPNTVLVGSEFTVLANSTLVTDVNGQVVFQGIVNGKYRYSAEKVDWLPVAEEITVDGDMTVNININPVPTYTIQFLINNYNPFTGSKVPYSGVSVIFAGLSKVTNSEGKVSFTVKAATYQYTISASQHVTQVKDYAVTRDDTITIDLAQIVYKTTLKVTGIGSAILQGARVTIGSQTLTTSSSGTVVFDLPNGSYTSTTTYTEYHPKQTNFTVNGSNQTINIPLDQITYKMTFVVKEAGAVSVGSRVDFGVNSQNTDPQGIAIFDVPVGAYIWKVTKTNWIQQTGNIDIIGQNVTKDINLVKDTGSLRFIVKDDSNRYVEGALVVCGGKTGTTNVNGQTTMTLPIDTYIYDVSRNPDFTSTTGSVSVIKGTKDVNVTLSNKKYSVTFDVSVSTNSGSQSVYNVPISFNGQTGYTTSSGRVTFTQIKNGNYNYTVASGSSLYNSYSSTAIVSNYDLTVPVTLSYKMTTSYVSVTKEGSRVYGVSVLGDIYYSDGSYYGSISDSTNSSGQISFSVPAGGRFTAKSNDSSCVNKSTSGSAGGTGYIYLYEAFILSFNTSGQNIINSFTNLNSDNAEASGNSVKICPYYSGSSTPSNMSISFANTNSLLSIDQWPESWGFSRATSMFQYCPNLSSITSGSPYFGDDVSYMFRGCTSLRNVPSGLLNRASGSNANSCFEGSGISGISGRIFGSNVRNYEYCFRNCTNLSSIGSCPFSTSARDLGGVFEGCTGLSSTGSSAFSGCSSATTIAYAFRNCTSLSSTSASAFSSLSSVTNCKGVFAGCSNLQSIPSNLFNYMGSTDYGECFYGCTSLSSTGSNIFSSNATSFYMTFENCSSLSSISNLKRVYSRCTVASRMFRNSGVQTIPGDFFSGWSSLGTVIETFQNCKNLTSITVVASGLFENCSSLKEVAELFSGCTNLSGDHYWIRIRTSTVLNNIKNYFAVYNNCPKSGFPYAYSNTVGLQLYAPIYTLVDALITSGSVSGVSRTSGFKACTKLLNQSQFPVTAAWK